MRSSHRRRVGRWKGASSRLICGQKRYALVRSADFMVEWF